MTQIVASLSEISDRYDAVFCDLWGCLHNGIIAFPEAVKALQAFRAGGGKVLLLTNAPRPQGQIAVQLDGLGAPRDAWDSIVTSGDTAQTAMIAQAVGNKVFHLGPARDEPFFTDMPTGLDATAVTRVPLDQADGIVCTGLVDDTTETPEDYRAQLLYAKTKGLKLLCANPDVVVDRGHDRVFCAGALAALYTEMGGESLYYGKPHPAIYDLARRRLAAFDTIPDDRILAIGDGPATDLAGAVGEDLDCLFVTGGLSAPQTETDGQPDPDKLATFLSDLKMSPPWAIGSLR